MEVVAWREEAALMATSRRARYTRKTGDVGVLLLAAWLAARDAGPLSDVCLLEMSLPRNGRTLAGFAFAM